MVLVALILQILGGVLVLAAVGWFFGFSVLNPYPWAWAAVFGAGAVAVLVVLFLYLAYVFSYQRIRSGQYEAAQTPTLVLGILSLFLGVIPGIFYLIGYVKLGDAVQEERTERWGADSFAPGSLVACKGCGRVFPVASASFCPFCGQRLAA